MKAPAILFLETMKPLSFLGSQLALFTVSSFLTLFGEYQQDGYNVVINLFEKPGNIERLIVTIESLSTEKRAAEEKPIGDKGTGAKKDWKSFLRQLFG